ncbi:MAG: isoleucine--tRNA ligase [Candidatus Bipolaricaulota bacterium]
MSFERLQEHPGAREAEVLAFWEENGIFQKSVEQTRSGPRFVFYEGPPTANGRPHFGHLMPRVYKDLYPRYKTMRGHYVGRKAGWDCHGLPVELEVERRLGLSSKQDIESYGMERFIKACKSSVQGYIRDWEAMLRRLGFWIDMDNPYVTYSDEYIESLWWELKTIHEAGYLYQGHKILPYCPRCGTGLSSHEVAQGYAEVEDPSVYVRFRLHEQDPLVEPVKEQERGEAGSGPVSLVVWTTTPWTLPANVAAAVDPRAAYALVKWNGERLLLAASRVEAVLGANAEVLKEVPGEQLIGMQYEPLYPLAGDTEAYRVVGADFVSMEEGTGVVHIAPAFGEDDYRLGQDEGLPMVQPVDQMGKFTEDLPLAQGEFVKDADSRIVDDLLRRGFMLRSEAYRHEYPFCWRCDTPLLYYAMDSWFVATTKVKDALVEANAQVNWYPEHVGRGRLGDFLSSLRDWAVSRERFWGTPLPVWLCEDCGGRQVVGSREELVEHAQDRELAASVELHRPYVDRVLLRCGCGGVMRRVPYVLDTWFDSGSMHTAQWHYPFENHDEFKDAFPADFISEALDQTRGWFYTLLATSVLLHGRGCYRNVLVTGMGLDATGHKMSKSRGNVLDPLPLADEHGADAIRWYVASESAPWSQRRLSEEGVRAARFRFLETVRHCHDFLALYAGIDGFEPSDQAPAAMPALDRWLLSRTAAVVEEMGQALDGFKVVEACRLLERYVDDLSNWYVRLARPRFWGEGMSEDKRSAYEALYQAMKTLSSLLAPVAPFLAESMWWSLRRSQQPASVHLAPWPSPGKRDRALEEQMGVARQVVSLGLAARNASQIKVRQPLHSLYVAGPDTLSAELWDLVRQELNVKEVKPGASLGDFQSPEVAPEFKNMGPRLGPLAKRAAEALAQADPQEVVSSLEGEGAWTVELDGRRVELRPEDVKVSWTAQEGYVVVQENERGVALDVRLDEGLQVEGELRELVHRLQLARKEAGFHVTDRIELAYQGEWSPLAEEHADRIAEEVLAVKMWKGTMEEAEHEADLTLGKRRGRVALRRVGKQALG